MQHVITKGITAPEGSVEVAQTLTASGAAGFDETIATGQTVFLINIAIPLVAGGLKSVVLSSDQTLTIKTNSSGGPDDTIVLPAGVPLEWQSTILALTVGGVAVYPCPFTVAVTKIYIANASGSTATLKIRVLSDATP